MFGELHAELDLFNLTAAQLASDQMLRHAPRLSFRKLAVTIGRKVLTDVTEHLFIHPLQTRRASATNGALKSCGRDSDARRWCLSSNSKLRPSRHTTVPRHT